MIGKLGEEKVKKDNGSGGRREGKMEIPLCNERKPMRAK